MSARRPVLVALALAALAPALAAAPAHADQAYDKVATAFAQSGGHLDPCAFTQAELEAAVRGIPPAIRNVVPALRRAMVDGIAAHQRGDCRGVRPAEEGTTGGATPGGAAGRAPPVTTPPVTTAPQTQTAPAVPPTATTPPPASTAPAATAPAAPATETGPREHDRTPLLVALVAAGALLLVALLLWALARLRGWDPAWAARVRHGWGEAGFRTTSTWSEFTDWLRLGR